MPKLKVARHHCGILVARQHDSKELRPTVAMLIYREVNGQNQVLLVRGAHSPRPLQFPQGGIERGELVDEAFYREAYEELSLPREVFARLEYVGYKVSFKAQRLEREKYKAGSLYFCLAAEVSEKSLITLNDENTTFEWVPFYEARTLLAREGKKSASVRSLEFLIKFQHKNLF